MNGELRVTRKTTEEVERVHEPFLGTHRALAVCARELARLSTAVERGVAALHADGIGDAPVVRQTPGRCIVQLGPVALTLAWLRSTHGAVADGELLVIVWRGAVAAPARLQPERAGPPHAAASAIAVWEEVLVADATSEESWTWQPRGGSFPRLSSTDLAAHCVEQLRLAHATIVPDTARVT